MIIMLMKYFHSYNEITVKAPDRLYLIYRKIPLKVFTHVNFWGLRPLINKNEYPWGPETVWNDQSEKSPEYNGHDSLNSKCRTLSVVWKFHRYATKRIVIK